MSSVSRSREGGAPYPEVGGNDSGERSHDDGVSRPEQGKSGVSLALGAQMGDEVRLT